MVPFSYFPSLLNSRVMNNYSSPVEIWALGASDFSEAWVSEFGAFALSCLPYFNSGPSFSSLLCGQAWFKAVLKGFKEI
jgi:hypothetical protein